VNERLEWSGRVFIIDKLQNFGPEYHEKWPLW